MNEVDNRHRRKRQPTSTNDTVTVAVHNINIYIAKKITSVAQRPKARAQVSEFLPLYVSEVSGWAELSDC